MQNTWLVGMLQQVLLVSYIQIFPLLLVLVKYVHFFWNKEIIKTDVISKIQKLITNPNVSLNYLVLRNNYEKRECSQMSSFK